LVKIGFSFPGTGGKYHNLYKWKFSKRNLRSIKEEEKLENMTKMKFK